MRRVAPVLLVLAVLACSGPAPDPGPKGKGNDWIADLPPSASLGGHAVKEEKSGAWTYRRAGYEAAAGGDDSGGEGMAFGGERLALADRGAPGAVAAPAAPPPMGGAAGAPAKGMDAAEEGASGGESDGIGGRADPGHGGAPLRAGAVDDNADLAGFVKFLAEWGDRPGIAESFDLLDVRDRRFVRVVNGDGKPVPAAEVRITDEAADKVLLAGTTYGDGRVPFYPHVAEPKGTTVTAAANPAGNLVVEVRRGPANARVRWDGKGEELAVTLDVAQPVADPVALDVLLLIDTTGSMGDEIERIKASLLAMTQKLRSLGREFDLRYGAVLYRDLGDEYVTAAHAFTADIQEFDAALKDVAADGGGDGPESLNQGLAEAVGRADWRAGAAKVLFLIADAPPHMDYDGDVSYAKSVQAAVGRGIRVHAVAASGIDEVGSLVFRQVAQFTRGKFIFIEYGSMAESAASHGVAGEVKSNNLDDILFTQIRDEVAQWGR